MIDKEKTISLLASLGSTAEEVRRSLQNLGIKGQELDCKNCPLNNFLQLNGIDYSPSLLSSPGDHWFYLVKRDCRLSGVAEFLRIFDRGYFPELISH